MLARREEAQEQTEGSVGGGGGVEGDAFSGGKTVGRNGGNAGARAKYPPKAFPNPGYHYYREASRSGTNLQDRGKIPDKRKLSRPYCIARFYLGVREPEKQLTRAAELDSLPRGVPPHSLRFLVQF